jgi:DNA-binding NarL/FixJ family response regulator
VGTVSAEWTLFEFSDAADRDFSGAKRLCTRPRESLLMQVILADNQAIYRTGIARVLLSEATIDVVAQCVDLPSMLEAVCRLGPSLVIFPSSFGEDLHEVLDRIEAEGSRAVIILEQDGVLDPGVAIRLQGAVLRSVAAAQLIDCLYSVAAGVRYMHRAVVKTMAPPADHAGVKAAQRLTPRELQIVALICEGLKNKQIALQLGTKEQVVKNNLRSIYAKAGVSDRLELALFTMHHRALAEVVEISRLGLVRTA